ncbi:acyl carrier protein [Candidatus Curtissbacteria bacterium]|nr:acyl carrier protein [Candidatus Curtissbacteria bacterium]
MVDYLEDIKKIISGQFGIEEEDIEEDSLLETDLAITDLDMEDLIASLEEKYEIQIPQAENQRFEKVSDIVSYLYDNVENRP